MGLAASLAKGAWASLPEMNNACMYSRQQRTVSRVIRSQQIAI